MIDKTRITRLGGARVHSRHTQQGHNGNSETELADSKVPHFLDGPFLEKSLLPPKIMAHREVSSEYERRLASILGAGQY